MGKNALSFSGRVTEKLKKQVRSGVFHELPEGRENFCTSIGEKDRPTLRAQKKFLLHFDWKGLFCDRKWGKGERMRGRGPVVALVDSKII